MNKLLSLLVLFTGLLSISTLCPDNPTLPTTSIPSTNPLVITPTSNGMKYFPATSTTQLSVAITVTPDEPCPAGGVWNLLTISITPSGGSEEYITAYIDCTDLNYNLKGWASKSSSKVFTTAIGSYSTFLTLDLAAKTMKGEYFSADKNALFIEALTIADGRVFDQTTKFSICADASGASPLSCTVSDFQIDYRYYGTNTFELGHVPGANPTLAAFYPLLDGPLTSLTNTISSTTSGYFGDKASNPTTGTSPTWDSSNSFVTIATGQYLTFPLPQLLPSVPTTSTTLTVSAWVRITTIPASTTTIFSMNADNGDNAGYRLTVDQSNTLKFYALNTAPSNTGTSPKITLNTWQLVGFSAYRRGNKEGTMVTFFVGSSWNQAYLQSGAVDLSSAAVLRVGGSTDSFAGDVSMVRIITPGGQFITTSDTCSSLDSITLGSGTFALSCSGSNLLSSVDSKCYASCPSDTIAATPFTDDRTSICLPISSPSSSSSPAKAKKSGLSAAVISAIVCGSIAVIAIPAMIIIIYIAKTGKSISFFSRTSTYKLPQKADQSPASPNEIQIPTSPTSTEAGPLVP